MTDMQSPVVVHDDARLAPELVDLLHDWDAHDEDEFTKEDAANEIREALRRACYACRNSRPQVVHERRCPERLAKMTPTVLNDWVLAAFAEVWWEAAESVSYFYENRNDGGSYERHLPRPVNPYAEEVFE